MMNTDNPSEKISSPERKSDGFDFKLLIMRLVICIVIIAFGLVGANYLISSSPKAKKKPPIKISPLVRVQVIYPETSQIIIPAMGTVIPAREVTLKSRVAGEIVNVHPEFIDGGFIKKGTKIIQIDDADYKLAVTIKKSDVISARFSLKLEQGHQQVARREWELLNSENTSGDMDAELALRKPHLEKAKADLAAAEADLNQALLNLERTKIVAPFNLIIRSKNIDIGSTISTQDSLAKVVDVDEYWIRVSVPADRLGWINIPDNISSPGAKVLINYRNGETTSGSVIKLLSDLEPEGRMARLLISIKDPLGINHYDNTGQDHAGPPLLLGEYVRAEIEGRQIDAAFRIPRTALRDNSYIWLAGKDDTLVIKPVKTIWRDKKIVIVKDGLQPGDRLIVSALSTPVEGMLLMIESDDKQNE